LNLRSLGPEASFILVSRSPNCSFTVFTPPRGGAIVYRAGQYYPNLITHIFSICTPFFPPSPVYEPLHILVEKRVPNFRYQEHFASGELEETLQSRAEIKQFLNGMYGARGPNGEVAFDATKGVFLANLPKLGMTTLLSEAELEYYAQEYARHGLHGPLNWYRNREVNYIEELEHFFKHGQTKEWPRVEQEVLFVVATKDQALKPHMAAKMEERISKLTRREVQAGHWALWEKPEEINGILKEWFDGVVFRGKSKL
jgi:soluble epoxide hydrolase / lipid-phosphate phosphatase